MRVFSYFLLVLAMEQGIPAQSKFRSVDDATEHVRARLLRSRVRSVKVERVELYPDRVAEAFGTLTVQRSDGEVVEDLGPVFLGYANAGVRDFKT